MAASVRAQGGNGGKAGRGAKAGADAPPATAAGPGTQRLRLILYLAFTLSGLTGLVYEATWTRYLQLFLGHAAYAQVLVLSLFMGGMAAGALLTSRLTRGRTMPLVAYAAVEAALGIAAYAFHPLFDAVTSYAWSSLLPGTQGSATASTVQWLLASALIIPQSVLLGMTFPLMSAAVLRLGAAAGGRVFAMLYFTNSAGAVVGVLLAGFWLIEGYGLRLTMMAAGAGNLAVAAVAAWVARRRAEAAPAVIRPARAEGVARWLLAVAFFTGAASFLYEIAWLRMLVLVQGASTHAFETMLSAFILGIALGGLWIRGRIERFKSPVAALAVVQILMGLAALATLPAYHYAFDVMQAVMARLPRSDLGYLGYNVAGYLISAGIMVPAAFCAGMTLPLLTFVLYSQGRGEAEIGAVYGWNTLGSIAAIALGSLVLMPLLGLKNLLVLGAGIDIALGVGLAAALSRGEALPAPRAMATLAVTAFGAAFAVALVFELDLTRTASGVFRHGRAHINRDANVVFHVDGRTATVDLVAHRDGTLAIATNGKTDAAINMARAVGNRSVPAGGDEFTTTFLGALPLAYAPHARRAAVIGHGSGLTTHVLLASPVIEQVDAIEIEPEMIRAARAFGSRVARAYDDPRSRYVIEDARAFFARSGPQYDIIVSEPSNPWVSGVASLYTPEFYRQAQRALAPGGLFVQWIQLYEFDRPLVNSILQGIGSVFPDYVLYGANDTDLVVVATASGAMPPPSDALFDWPLMRAELEYLDIRTPAQLSAFRVAARRAYAPLLERGRVNSDYFPFLEFHAARARFFRADDENVIRLARDPLPALEILSGFAPPTLAAHSEQGVVAYKKFLDIQHANMLVEALGEPGTGPPRQPLSKVDASNVQRIRGARADMSAQAWHEWFAAVLDVSKPLIANGGTEALARAVGIDRADGPLRGAPPQIREKVEFMFLVGRRDLDAIRKRGPPLLEGPMKQSDPTFGAYVLLATSIACVAGPPDPACRPVLALLHKLAHETPLIALLRAHDRARG